MMGGRRELDAWESTGSLGALDNQWTAEVSETCLSEASGCSGKLVLSDSVQWRLYRDGWCCWWVRKGAKRGVPTDESVDRALVSRSLTKIKLTEGTLRCGFLAL